MPPDKYKSITVHEDVLARLNEYRSEAQSFSAAIGTLLDEAEGGSEDVPEGLERLEELVQEMPERTAALVEQRMRR